ncbi:reverse transcriptase domain-containing protein [Exiguobacterium sp. s129]|uniref:reverse transcriptase domain-containing protein n=1 Tax=Exiguobacterium sp. s129 TaxID=2751264 RepID=UPI001BEA604C|nr:reverse transcriptase domain-containing protein [Exiguobacterium sp. s129]
MKQANKVFKTKMTLRYLNEKYPQFIKNNTASGIDRVTKKTFDTNLEENILNIIKKVNQNNYKFTYYKEKLILKNRNSLPRLISIPTIRDRIVLKVLHEMLMEVFELKLDLVQTLISRIIKKSNLYDSYIKIDLTNFFGSLDHDVLNKSLNRKIRSKKILKLINCAIKNPTVNINYRKTSTVESPTVGVPQGVPIANTLAEIYFKSLDDKYKNMSNIAYFRYVDDILILCNEDDQLEIKEQIIKDLIDASNMKLIVNEDKTVDGHISDKLTFLGYEFEKKNSKVICRVKKESKLKIENAIIDILTSYKNSNGKISVKELEFYLNLKITGAIVEENGVNKKYGWLFFYSQINDIKTLYHLDNFIEKQLKRFGINRNDSIAIKKFVKAYYEIIQRRSKSKYIYNPSELTLDQKRKLLRDVFSIKDAELRKDNNVEYIFYKKVYKKIYELEADVQDAY